MVGRESKRASNSDRGFVLVNALLIVAAMAVAAALLMGRAQSARARLDLAQGTAQVHQYLDSGEALAITLLNRDLRGAALDHPGEPWAKPHDVDVDRDLTGGRLSVQVVDIQGLFNVNTLSDPEAIDPFMRLAERIALSDRAARAIAAHIAGPPRQALGGYARAPVPQRPRGGAIVLLDELRHVPGVTPVAFARLRKVAAALPANEPLNINSAPEPVLAALLPELGAAARQELLSLRSDAPFQDTAVFLQELDRLARIDPDAPHLQPERFTVESSWFLVDTAARLSDRENRNHLARHSVIRRIGQRRLARVVHRTATQEQAEQ